MPEPTTYCIPTFGGGFSCTPAEIRAAAGRTGLVALRAAPVAEARGGGHSSSYCASCARDSNGRIARSPEARERLMRETGYPHSPPGYVIDHIIPLKRGGADLPANMQWQTKADAKAKDRWE